jgi:leucyl/phenylalanyl-tRNA---protein transferase
VISFLSENDAFPPLSQATEDGLLAFSETLDAVRLLNAYRQGIFPWYSPPDPVLWWSTDPRMVLFLDEFKLHRSLRKRYLQWVDDPTVEVVMDRNFSDVMRACAGQTREGQEGTWITDEIVDAYTALHVQGFAHSVETWINGELVAGLYGVAIGKMFYGESMFTRVTDGSKIAFMTLVAFLRQAGVTMIDCQQQTVHLTSLGGRVVPRDEFIVRLQQLTAQPSATWPVGDIKYLPLKMLKV